MAALSSAALSRTLRACDRRTTLERAGGGQPGGCVCQPDRRTQSQDAAAWATLQDVFGTHGRRLRGHVMGCDYAAALALMSAMGRKQTLAGIAVGRGYSR